MTVYRLVPTVEFMRRGDQVAVVANGLVVHLDPATARAIGAMLIEAADTIQRGQAVEFATMARDRALNEAFG